MKEKTKKKKKKHTKTTKNKIDSAQATNRRKAHKPAPSFQKKPSRKQAFIILTPQSHFYIVKLGFTMVYIIIPPTYEVCGGI